ncbi:hypothetical protein J8L86_14655 [Shewanella sp. MMG014]|uniref:hypothetical protein n=1 Tax=Shewanella sp. MMG014 TaxID=2822691 RepID=UPI001B376765|nr:hypothetical protein [Shewanella sp. MMG014]MBQ4891094.1 hypothetical protein [Shewanella sp. MMG014]
MSWYFYLYIALFAAYQIYIIKGSWFVEERDFWWGALHAFLLTSAVVVFADYANWLTLPYQWLASAVTSSSIILIVGFILAQEFNAYYNAEDEDEGTVEDKEKTKPDTDSFTTSSPSSVYSFSELAVANNEDSSTQPLNIDQYRPVSDPAEIGDAIGKLFSSNSTDDELAQALEKIGGTDDEEDDEDTGSGYHFAGTTIVFACLSPAIYIAWLVLVDNTQGLIS